MHSRVVAAYGDPCRECGFSWSLSLPDAVVVVRNLPDAVDISLRSATGRERNPALAWNVTGYVCHVADNLRIWAERLMGVIGGSTKEVGRYDNHLLAEARGYEGVSLPGALWSLRRSVDDWLQSVEASDQLGTVLVHPDRGPLSLLDVARSNAHDAFHHQWDIGRILQEPSG